jgi:uncharacterized protein (UPF0276 family)
MSAPGSNGSVPAAAGIGLRLPHHAAARDGSRAAAWLEVHPENYLADAAALAELEAVRERYPLSLHAVGLSPGSAEGIDPAHVARLRALERLLRPGLVSDHLAWCRSGESYFPDLLPLPYTEESLGIVCGNVDAVQQALGRQLLIENPSTYLRYADSPLPEPEFLAELVRRTGCGVLLDVNNLYVSACNLDVDPDAALDAWLAVLPPEAIGEIHLAGHALVLREGATLRIDDHGSPVCPAVWRLYERALALLGPVPTLVEWDTALPAFAVLAAEAGHAQRRLDALESNRARVA